MTDRDKLTELQKEAIRLFMERQTDEPLTDFITNYLITNGVTVQKHGELGSPYLDEYFGQFAYCKECGADNVLPCNYCRECGRKIDNPKDSY